MTGISGISIESMLANPSLIPTLPKGSEIRCHDLTLENTRPAMDKRIRDLYQTYKSAGSNIQIQRAKMFLQTCSASSFRAADKSGCKELEKVLKLADQMGFTVGEKAFIQCHEIGGQKYIFVADCHNNPKFRQLWSSAGLYGIKREIAIFREIGCRDPQSEKDYVRFMCGLDAPGMPSPWIFGLEGSAWPLQLCMMSLLIEEISTNPRRLESFLDDLLINRPWDEVMRVAHANKPFTQTAALLFQEIQENLSVMNTPNAFRKKRQTLYNALFQKHSEGAWRDLFFGLAKTCLLDVPTIQKAFSPAQSAFIGKLLLKPDEENRSRFLEEVQSQMRDHSMARSLFSAELPKETVRLAQIGYLHLPGVICELEKLAAAAKNSQENKKA